MHYDYMRISPGHGQNTVHAADEATESPDIEFLWRSATQYCVVLCEEFLSVTHVFTTHDLQGIVVKSDADQSALWYSALTQLLKFVIYGFCPRLVKTL